MNNFFKKWRKANVNNIGKYLIYALGEILLIIIGILIAVSINKRQTAKTNKITQCQYLQELKFAFEQDKVDVEINYKAFKRWNPKLKIILNAIDSNSLAAVDSLTDKINAIGNYVTFLQQSKGKIEELKYSNINLIANRNFKNRILVYQETKISFLLEQQRRFNQLNDKIDDYFLKKKVLIAEELEKDEYFYQLTNSKYRKHETMLFHYENLLKELLEMNEIIEAELEFCKEDKE